MSCSQQREDSLPFSPPIFLLSAPKYKILLLLDFFLKVSCTDWPGREISVSLPFSFCLGWWVRQSRNILFTLAASLSVLWHRALRRHGLVLLPFYPLLKFGSCCSCCLSPRCYGDNCKLFWVGHGFQWHRIKKLPTKKKPAKAKTKTKKDIAINNLPVCLGRVLCVLAAVLSHCWKKTAFL